MERNFKASKRFYIVSFIAASVLVALVVAVVYLLTTMSGHVRKLRSTTIYSEIESSAIIIREEMLVTESAHSYKILRNEGDSISIGDEVAILYPYNYESQMERICTAESELFTRMEAMLLTTYGGALPANITAYTDGINQLCEQLRAIANGESDADYAQTEAQLMQVLAARRTAMQTALGDISSLQTALDELDRLYAAFETQTAIRHLSKHNGYISFFTDTNEETLRDVSQLTVSQVKRVLSSTSVLTPETGMTYRVVTDRNKWYVAFVIDDESDSRLMPGLAYSFTIKGVEGSFQGTVVSEKDAQNGVLYVMQVQSDVQPVLTMRVVEVSIQNNATGLYVPLEYLEFASGVPYLTIKTDYGYQAIPVYIAASDGEDVIVSARDEGIQLFAGLKYRMPLEDEE